MLDSDADSDADSDVDSDADSDADQGPAGAREFVLMKPVWARSTLSSCNGLLSYCKALDLAAELWPPDTREIIL
jgi:hypothetical protein